MKKALRVRFCIGEALNEEFMQSRLSARMAFVIAIGLLIVCGILVWNTFYNLAESERLVDHTRQVQDLLGKTESAIATAARARLNYVFNGDDTSLTQYQRGVAHISDVLGELRASTNDNPAQRRNCAQLQTLLNDRIQLWERSVALKRSGLPAPEGQPEMTRQSVVFADETARVTAAMRDEESHLLEERSNSLHMHFIYAVITLVVTFTAAVLLLLWHYRLLRDELHARELAQADAADAAKAAIEAEHKAQQSEQAARVSQEAARALSAHLLQLQDDERRRLARELHDSIGQYLAAAKMMLQQLANSSGNDKRLSESIDLIDQSIRETRTISHLLHPPGLDEAGFSSAATWYAEGFARRSGLDLNVQIPELTERLSRHVEIALFRVLQESLTNIHRHSKSRSAETILEVLPGSVVLTIRDRGVGIPRKVLERFQASGTSGVGLAGMRERIRELGGTFAVESDSSGTCVRVSLPVAAARAQSATEASA